MKKEFGEYFLGFDMGTDSVGWAVTDLEYNVQKINNKPMWGIHLFEAGKTAEERRMHRCARRRTARSKERISLLKMLFKDEIDKKDVGFYERLNDSKYYYDDKTINQRNTLFNDKNFDDKDFHNQYPTIYHLRSALIHNDNEFDVRLVYLAIHHIIKHRGHFLFEGQDFQSVTSFKNVFKGMIETFNDYGIDFEYINEEEIKELLKDKLLKITERKKNFKILMEADTTQKSSITDLLAGGKVALSKIFQDETLDECEIPKISFCDGIDENVDKLTDILDERMFILSKMKAVYDWSILTNILQDKQYLSDAKMGIYDQHSYDLKLLKSMVKEYLTTNDYKEIFKAEDVKTNYCAYIGSTQNKDKILEKTCDSKEFCDYIIGKFKKVVLNKDEEHNLIERLKDLTALPKQVSKENGVIPYQLHLYELKSILKNAERYLPFLTNKDEQGLTVSDKIISIDTFRIPYYVGPLNPHSKYAWIEKIKNEKIYPWNFDKVIDKQKCADEFITRMTNKCTYLKDKDVLPKNSVLYSKYNILNQLNNVRINGEKLQVEIKQGIYNDLFLNIEKVSKITIKKIKMYLKNKSYFDNMEDIEVTGTDEGIVGNMKTYLDFKKIFGNNMPEIEKVDAIVSEIVILGQSKNLLKDYLYKHYGDDFTNEQLNGICKLNYSGWGQFSQNFLTDICNIDERTGECKNIISMLYETDNNLMQLLSNEYQFVEKINEYNKASSKEGDGNTLDLIDKLYVSPAVKRGIWRTLMICKEIVKVTGHDPKKIFIEMARGEEMATPKGKRTSSRKAQLLGFYKQSKIDEAHLLEELDKSDEGELRDNRLYLYYAQMGRCMYSGERINIRDIYTLYDIDHIYPQCRVKDDSMSSNKVLVKRTLNARKGELYPIPGECITNEARRHWSVLHDKGLITKEKYYRLSRKTTFTESELGGFIARQLVETRQSTKAVANLLTKLYPSSKIVYVKAGNVSSFRHEYGIIKSRLVNDYHHAKDAYLNIVVGNVYDEKFTSNPVNFIKSNKKYSMNRVFEYSLKKSNSIIWDAENYKSLIKVKKQAEKNNILFTRYATTNNSLFFDQMPVKAGNGQFPLKTSDIRLHNIERYGAYNSIKSAYYFLVEHTCKKKVVRTIEFVPVYLADIISRDKKALEEYTREKLKLDNFRILIPKIKINTLFKVDGFYMHLSGRTLDRLSFKRAMPLVISKELYSYSKKIEKYVERNKTERTIFPITQHQKITKEENLNLYEELLHKLRDTIYNAKLSSQVETFEKNRSKFKDLTLENQCTFLYNAFGLFDTSPTGTDLTLIGGSKNSGIILVSSNINKLEQVSIINQSVTGIFFKEINLKTI